MQINHKKIAQGEAVYLIAEIGSNHNQDKSLALEMINMAAESGADAVKFQSIRFDKLYQPNYETTEFKQWFKSIELNESWYHDLAQQAKKVGVDFISSPTYLESIDLLEECNVPVYKIASPQVQGDLDIVQHAAHTGKPIILSLGYCEPRDVSQAINVALESGNKQIALLHCISNYPSQPKQANLNYIQTLSQTFNYPVGFSDHSLGDHLAIAAVVKGACIIEKHVTLDRAMTGPDHHFAMTFTEFKNMAQKIRDVSSALGDGQAMPLAEKTVQYRHQVAHKLFSTRALKAGDRLNRNDIIKLRHENKGIEYSNLDKLLQLTLTTDINKGELLQWQQFHLDNNEVLK